MLSIFLEALSFCAALLGGGALCYWIGRKMAGVA